MSGGFSNGRGCRKGRGWVSKGVGGFFGQGLVAIGGVDVAVELAEAGAMLMWQPMWWRRRTTGGAVLMWHLGWWMWTTMGETVLMWQQKWGGADNDGRIGDVAHPGAANRWLEGRWGADPGCDSLGGTLFPLLLTVLLTVAGSVIIVIVELVIRSQISLAWLA